LGKNLTRRRQGHEEHEGDLGFILKFLFGEFETDVFIKKDIPQISEIADNISNCLVVCDENTGYIADKICDGNDAARCVLKSGEENKNWGSVEEVLRAAFDAGLGRDALFIAVGGGVIGDIAGFAASIYMRGCAFVLVSTTLLGMVDASVGGKTGFDLFDIKNLAGTFYPAEKVFISVECLSTLAEKEIKSGMAELIKTAVLAGGDFLDELVLLAGGKEKLLENVLFQKCIEKAVNYKGGIVSRDFRESELRMLLNLGHTFGHALESSCGLGKITHGEAVAWGIVRSCELGMALNITPKTRAEKIINLIKSYGYEYASPHPECTDTSMLYNSMNSDKKKKSGKLKFIVPDAAGARIVEIDTEEKIDIVKRIINGGAKN
jgi:3-dehydroquinate synthase